MKAVASIYRSHQVKQGCSLLTLWRKGLICLFSPLNAYVFRHTARYFMLRTAGALQDFMRKAHWWPLCRNVRSIWRRFSMAGLATESLLPASSPVVTQSIQPRMHNDAGASHQLAAKGFEIKCQQQYRYFFRYARPRR